MSVWLANCLCIYLSTCLSVYLCLPVCLTVCRSVGLSVYLSISAFTLNQYILTHASIPYHIEIGPKWLRAVTTHLPRPKRPTPKIGWNDPGRNDPAETTQGQNDPEPACLPGRTDCLHTIFDYHSFPTSLLSLWCILKAVNKTIW